MSSAFLIIASSENSIISLIKVRAKRRFTANSSQIYKTHVLML